MKDTIQNYGWIVIGLIVLSIVIALASPLATAVADNIMIHTDDLGDEMDNAPDYIAPYAVKLNKNIQNGGTVTFTDNYSGDKIYLKNEDTVTFKAINNIGFKFLGWSVNGEVISTSKEYSCSVNSQTTITAMFKERLAPGLYDSNDNLIATFNQTGMDVTKDYTSSTYKNDTSSPSYILKHPELYPDIDLNSVTKIVVPIGAEKIGDYSFYDCGDLTSIDVPDGVKNIGDYAFVGCISLADIELPDSLIEIGNNAFYLCVDLISIKIPDSVTSIGNNAFNKCDYLTSINIPNGIKAISENMFNGCYNLVSIDIPNSVKSIGQSAFGGCLSLASIEIPDSVTVIGNYAFSNCSSLTSVVIPNSVTSIGTQAFWNCTNLTSVTAQNITPPTLGGSVFKNCSSLSFIYVPEGSVENYKTTGKWVDYADKIYSIPTT